MKSPTWPVVNSATDHTGIILAVVVDICMIAAACASNNMEACLQS